MRGLAIRDCVEANSLPGIVEENIHENKIVETCFVD